MAPTRAPAKPTNYWFEWGTSPSSLTDSSTSKKKKPRPATPTISTVAEGLEPDTIYFFRASAKNAASEVSHGDILQFRTLPAVQSLETKPATEVKPHTAELNASYVGDGTPRNTSSNGARISVYGQHARRSKTPAADRPAEPGPGANSRASNPRPSTTTASSPPTRSARPSAPTCPSRRLPPSAARIQAQ